MEKPSEIRLTKKRCRVCKRHAQAVRYGAFTCNECADFFSSMYCKIYAVGSKGNTVQSTPKLGLTMPIINDMRPCYNNQQCTVVEDNVNKCKECRFRKCLNVGMRYITKMYHYPQYQGVFKKSNIKELLDAIREAHLETIYLIGPPFDPIRTTEPRERVSKSCCVIYFAHSPEIAFDAVKRVKAFAKKLFRVGGLPKWNQDISWNAVFDVLLLRLARTFNPKSNTLTCWNGQVVVKDQFSYTEGLSFSIINFWREVFDFAEILYNLNLSDEEVNLFCLVIIVYEYQLNAELLWITETYHALMEILEEFVINNHGETCTNCFTAFKILLFRTRYLKNYHSIEIPREIFEGLYAFSHTSVPHQSACQFAVCSKSNPTFPGQQTGNQSLYHPSTATVEKSDPNPSSSIHSNPIIQCYPSNQQDLPMLPAGKTEPEKKIVNQTQFFVPQDQNSSMQGGMEGSSQFSGQNQKLVEVIESETSKTGSATGFCTTSNMGLGYTHPNEHLKHTSSFSNPVDCPPIASEYSENFSNDDMPLDLSCKFKTFKDKEYYFKKDS